MRSAFRLFPRSASSGRHTVAGFFFGTDAVRGSLTSQFRSTLGETGSQAVEAMLKGAESAIGSGIAAVFGIGLLVVAALGVVVQLRVALNSIFETKEPDDAGVTWYARVYALSFAGILAFGFLLAIAQVVSAGLAAFAAWFSGSVAECPAHCHQLHHLARRPDAAILDALQMAA